jgi:hypothetical protein
MDENPGIAVADRRDWETCGRENWDCSGEVVEFHLERDHRQLGEQSSQVRYDAVTGVTGGSLGSHAAAVAER